MTGPSASPAAGRPASSQPAARLGSNANRFDPPTPAQLAEHLDANPAVLATGWRAYLPQITLIGMAMLIVFVLLQPGLIIVPLLLMAGLVVYLSSRTRAASELSRRVTRAWELSMIRRHREALGEAWRLLPECRTTPELHGRVVGVLAHSLGDLCRDDAAEVARQYLLDRMPPDHPLALRLRIQQAMSALTSDRLADADDALRKLRGRPELDRPGPLAGLYTLARLLQDVRTGHYADAVEQAEAIVEALKPLGVEAGYGHALLALCHHQLAAKNNPTDASDHEASSRAANHAEQAKRLRNNATILIPPAALMCKLPDLVQLLQPSASGQSSAAP